MKEFQHRAGGFGDFLRGVNELLLREIVLRRAGHEVKAHLSAADHHGVAHVVARVAHVHQLDALQMAEVLLNGEEVRQNLGGMGLVGQAVEHGNSGVAGQFLYPRLLKAAVLDAVIHPAQYPGGVGNGLLHADLRGGGIQEGGAHAQIPGGNLKGTASTGGILLKDQSHVFPLQIAVGNPGFLFRLQIGGGVQKLLDLGGRKVHQLQKMSVIFHGGVPLFLDRNSRVPRETGPQASA